MSQSECMARAIALEEKGDIDGAIRQCENESCSEVEECQRYLVHNYYKRGDVEKTLFWSRKLAEFGKPEDLFYVGLLYRSKNEKILALDYFRRSAESGFFRAYHVLGDIYAYGIGVPVDIEMALEFYEKSAAKGFFMGRMRLLHLRRKLGGVFANIVFPIRILILLAQGIMIAIRNPADYRLVDMPGCGRNEEKDAGGI